MLKKRFSNVEKWGVQRPISCLIGLEKRLDEAAAEAHSTTNLHCLPPQVG
jgi:hypothetical protein